MFSNGVREKSLDDTGTRYLHYRELADTWEDGIIAVERRRFPNAEDAKKVEALKAGVLLIDNILSSLSDYHGLVYRVGSIVDSLKLNQTTVQEPT